MKTKTLKRYTPGPWIWDGNFTVTIPLSPDGETSFRTFPEDARLIAAAPDLLEACKLFVAGDEARFMPGYQYAKDAIAKAEGR